MVDLVYFGKKRPKVIRAVPEKQKNIALALAKREMDKEAKDLGIITKHIGVLACNVKEAKEFVFEPFVTVSVDSIVAQKLLENCGDLFFKVGEADRKEEQKPDHNPSADGYVGDLAADQISDLDKQRKKDQKAEEGKSIKEIIDSDKKKKEKEKNG